MDERTTMRRREQCMAGEPPLCSFCVRTIENHRYRARTSATIAVGDCSRVWSVVPDGAPLDSPHTHNSKPHADSHVDPRLLVPVPAAAWISQQIGEDLHHQGGVRAQRL